jgi:sarcosine oxidase subunit gamma
MVDVQALRRPPTTGLTLISGARSVTLSPVLGLSRFAVRSDGETAALVGRGFGCPLPMEPLRAAAQGGRAALWLGPDEWLLLAEDVEPEAVTREIVAALGERPYSWVDISHRNAGFLLSGTHATAVLNAGCPLPLDLKRFPVGKCTRTLFGKAEIVLWRVGETAFRIEVWRSFASYLAGLIVEAAREHEVSSQP